ncbi:MAG TPA: PDC sensor domain-containing protein [Gemmatimonadaceae bacterium]
MSCRPMLVLMLLAPAMAAAQRQPERNEIYAQRILRELVRRHHDEVSAMELALATGGRCVTIAATDPKDIGEKCDADELGPIRTGAPTIEAPTSADPVFDITQALHDKSGRLIGALGTDVIPTANGDRAVALARAEALRRELEALIPSAAALSKR